MRLTVFGATGRTGRHVLEHAAQRGHTLTAFTRRPDALEPTGAIRELVTGDVYKPAFSQRLVARLSCQPAVRVRRPACRASTARVRVVRSSRQNTLGHLAYLIGFMAAITYRQVSW